MSLPVGTIFKHSPDSLYEWEIYDLHVDGDHSKYSTDSKGRGTLYTMKDRSSRGPLIITYMPNLTKLEKLIYNIP